MADVPVTTPTAADKLTHLYCQYTIRTARRDEVRQRLTEAGIGTAIYYPIPMHRQALYESSSSPLPVCDKAAQECLSLPIYPELTEEQIKSVVEHIERVFE